MKILWCWRCQTEVPMLDEAEYKEAARLYSQGFRDEASEPTVPERFKDITDYYFHLTGYLELNPNAIMHHRIALYGPPCESCGKPYRTSKASFCAACGHKRPR